MVMENEPATVDESPAPIEAPDIFGHAAPALDDAAPDEDQTTCVVDNTLFPTRLRCESREFWCAEHCPHESCNLRWQAAQEVPTGEPEPEV